MPATDDLDLASTDERTIIDLAGRGLAPLMALGRYRYLRAHDALPPQAHASLVVLALPVRGSFTFTLDGEPFSVGPGAVLRVRPRVTYLTGTTVQPRGELAWLIVRTAPDGSGPLDRAVSVLAGAGPPVWHAPEGAVDAVHRALGLGSGTRTWINDARLGHVLADLLLSVAAAMIAAPEAGVRAHPNITRALTWLEDHLAEPVEAADLAAVSGLSTSHFYDAFRAVTGTSPKDYLLRRKTDRARDWLENRPEMTVTEMAHALGFPSSQYFATVFRRYQHRPPSAYRAQR